MTASFGCRWTLVGALAFAAATEAEAQSFGAIGLVVVSLRTAGVESPYLDECPAGVAVGNDEIWWKSLSPRDRDRLTDGGEKEPSARRITATLRGPAGEDVCWNPTSVVDPKMRVVSGAHSIGFNLDGTETGHATGNSCTHEKFTTPDGAGRIDNQMHRLVGCIHGWRGNGYIEMTSDTERRNSSQGVILIQITGVESLTESPAVTVRFYRAADVMPKDQTGNILPFASYRIDGNPRYGATAHGRIRNGVLTTDPVDVRLPFFGNRVETEFLIRDLRLELSITDTGARGLIGGYHDLENWWDYVRKMGYLVETAQFSCPALYAAARALADGDPDPETGACRALSVAYRVEAVRAFVNETPKPVAASPAFADIEIDTTRLPSGVAVGAISGGKVLTTVDGRTLYARRGTACEAACADRFSPFGAAWGATGLADWTVIPMPDLTRQWAHRGHPVFTCADDHSPGDALCAEADWRPLIVHSRPALPSSLTVQPSEVGPVVADQKGRTLYRLIGELSDFEREICNRACLDAKWRIAMTDERADRDNGPFGIATENGSRVWTFRQRPVYTFAGDAGPGNISGHRFGGASVSAKNWFSAITLEDALADEPTLNPTEE